LKRLFVACLWLVSCQREDKFAAFVDNYVEAANRWSPTAAVENGFHAFDNLIEDRAPAAHNRRLRQLRIHLTELAALRQTGLTKEQTIDADMIEAQVRADLLDIDELKTWQRNPMQVALIPGNAIDAVMKRNFAPAPQRVLAATARLKGVPALMNSLRDATLNPPAEFTDLAISVLDGTLPFLRTEAAQWAHGAGAAPGVVADFDRANAAAIKSVEATIEWMKAELKPRSKGHFALGREAYARKLLYEEMVDIPLPRLLEIGQQALDRDFAALLAAAKQLAPNAPPAETVRHISDDHPAAGQLVDAAKATLEETRQFLIDQHIVTVPGNERPAVEETPSYARSGSFASLSSPGAFEAVAKEAYYFVTPVEPRWTDAEKDLHLRLFNPAVMKMITIHEAFPGHYLQFLYSPQFPTKTRKLLGAASNAEGWAHYAEQMMLEQGFGQGGDEKARLKLRIAQLQEALIRDCRYVAGIKMHTEGWTVEQATQLFMDKTFYGRPVAYPEARRGTFDPTYLYYTLGKLMIYKLRGDYQAARGTAYSLGSFHNEFVRQGAAPLKLVRRALLGADGPLL
jgi:hypothetical protein